MRLARFACVSIIRIIMTSGPETLKPERIEQRRDNLRKLFTNPDTKTDEFISQLLANFWQVQLNWAANNLIPELTKSNLIYRDRLNLLSSSLRSLMDNNAKVIHIGTPEGFVYFDIRLQDKQPLLVVLEPLTEQAGTPSCGIFTLTQSQKKKLVDARGHLGLSIGISGDKPTISVLQINQITPDDTHKVATINTRNPFKRNYDISQNMPRRAVEGNQAQDLNYILQQMTLGLLASRIDFFTSRHNPVPPQIKNSRQRIQQLFSG